MSGKNYGPSVSGYLDPSGRNWETAVFQAGKPVLDKELNLAQDLDEGFGQTSLRRALPSGWLADDFLATSDPITGVFSPSATVNTFTMPATMTAHVNGWMLKVANTNVSGTNTITLTTSPSGAGVRRTDILVLEVWRKLISAQPSTDGKSASGRIWLNGNVKNDPSADLSLNLVDDLEDVNVGSETTKRVQIQYRLRVIPGIDLFAFPYGIDDPLVVANTVPASAAAPDGVATAFNYTNQSSNGDPGLWVAGDGNPANSLGTVDGLMYAIPVMAVFRRNSTAFDRRTNHNGGVASPGVSDRPDGLFYNLIAPRDVVDLRMGVSTVGWSFAEVLEKNVNYLFDNDIYTDWTDTSPFGGGYRGATVFAADEIGVSNGNGGDGITTGTTGVGQFVGQFDAARRRYSGRSIYESVIVTVPAPGGAWSSGQTLTIDPTALPIYPYTAFNWTAYAPAGVVIHSVVDAWWIGSGSPKKTAQAINFVTQTNNLGAIPVVSLSLKLGNIASLSLTNETLYVELLIAYPPSNGLSRTPTGTFGSGSFFINNPGQMPAGAPVSFAAFANQTIDTPHREVQLEYRTVTLTITVSADTTISGKSTFNLPERANSLVSVQRNATPIVGSATLDVSGRVVTLSNVLDFTSPGDNLTVQYTAVRPMPQNGEQMTIYYEARAPQAARGSLLGTNIQVIPKYVSPWMYAITTGSGSQDEGYPFPQSYVQTGGIYPTSGGTYTGEGELSARGDISVANFNASTGFMRLPVYIPMVADPQALIFQRGLGDIDVEGRSFFKTSLGSYVPNAYAEDLSDPKRHKNILPILAELAADSALGRRGQLVLVLLLRYAVFDEADNIAFNANLTLNTTVASVFRIKGNLLDKRVV